MYVQLSLIVLWRLFNKITEMNFRVAFLFIIYH